MRRGAVRAVAATAVIAAMGLLGASGTGGAAETITAFVGEAKIKVADVGRKGPSPGDDVLVRASLYADEARSVRIGRVRAACEQLDRNHLYCWNENTIDDRGEITSEGTQDLRSPLVLDPITGGTGEFAGALGTATVDFSTGMVTFAIG
ncbi:MAG TPA: hypothetical protein VE669_04545 [Actinomycetota bacterium]|nr:hypothetical protein [Actinomycetota bacterium]